MSLYLRIEALSEPFRLSWIWLMLLVFIAPSGMFCKPWLSTQFISSKGGGSQENFGFTNLSGVDP